MGTRAAIVLRSCSALAVPTNVNGKSPAPQTQRKEHTQDSTGKKYGTRKRKPHHRGKKGVGLMRK